MRSYRILIKAEEGNTIMLMNHSHR